MLAQILLVSVCGWLDGPDPAALVARLSSPVAAEREEAAGAVEELGRAALPALYNARETARGDLARRVDLLADLIERQRLLRATRVRLDLDDRPVAEVVETLRARTGFPLALDDGTDDAHRSRRVTLRAPGAVGFWEALDRLAAAGGVRHNPAEPYRPFPRRPSVNLVADDGPPAPACFAGPFRINLVRVSRHLRVEPARPPAPPGRGDTTAAVLQVFAEPGLAVNANGPPVLQEATDDHGRDLRPESLAPYPRPPVWPHRFDEGDPGVLQVTLALRPPEAPGGRLGRLRGFIPVTVVAQADGPAVVPLNDTPGRWHAADGVELSLRGVSREGDQTTITLAVRGELAGPPMTPFFTPAPLGDYLPPFRFEDHVRVVDARGEPCSWYTGPQHAGPAAGEQDVALVVTGGGARAPARVLYHRVVGAASELVFEFSGLPLP